MPLTIVPTPIGNLADVTLRALEVLKTADQILCEDTRVSRALLNHHTIRAQLTSYHAFNERARLKILLEKLQAGEHLALISSAGTPGVCDPGQRLIAASLQASIEVRVLPGPCALITALVTSGFDAVPFQFVGFLERSPKRQCEAILAYPSVSICYESPKRVVKSLSILQNCEQAARMVPRPVAVIKELTKKFERHFRGTAKEILAQLQEDSTSLRGEWVLVIGPSLGLLPPLPLQSAQVYAHLQEGLNRGLSKSEVAADLATRHGVKRQEFYRILKAFPH